MILGAIAKMIPTAWLWPIAGVAFVVLASFAGVQTLRLEHSKTKLAKTQSAWSTERAQLLSTGLDAATKYRAAEQSFAAERERLRHENAVALARGNRAADAFRAERDRVRDELAAFAARGRDAAGDPASTCPADLAAAGELLDAGLRLQVELASAAETHLADARTLLEWADEVKANGAKAKGAPGAIQPPGAPGGAAEPENRLKPAVSGLPGASE